jgi:hypothetical protein
MDAQEQLVALMRDGNLRQVEFVIREDESTALDWGTLRVVGPRRYEVGHSLTDAAVPVLRIQLASTGEEARTAATALYAEIRDRARLPVDLEPIIRLVARVAGVPVDADEHLFEAQRLRDENRFELAVIEAQTFAEMHLRYYMELVASHHSDALLSLTQANGKWSLLERPAQQLFAILLDRAPTTFPDWADYRLHVERRNEIAHRGLRATRADADTSIAAVTRLRFFVEAAATEAIEKLDKLQADSQARNWAPATGQA